MAEAERPLGYDTRFGGGFISGVFAVALAALGFGGVLCVRALGLDWFLLDVLVLAMLFVPLERVFARPVLYLAQLVWPLSAAVVAGEGVVGIRPSRRRPRCRCRR